MNSDISYVRYQTFIRCIWIELPLEPVGCNYIGLSFACPWVSVSDLNLYPSTLHQPLDPINSALLPAIAGRVDLAIAINAARLQSELFVCPVSLRSA